MWITNAASRSVYIGSRSVCVCCMVDDARRQKPINTIREGKVVVCVVVCVVRGGIGGGWGEEEMNHPSYVFCPADG